MDPQSKWVSPVVPWEAADDELKVLLRHAWESGDLSYKLTPSQAVVYTRYRAWESAPLDVGDRIFCLDSSRRWGKSNMMLTAKIEDCIRNPGWRIPYIAPTNKDVLKITRPLVSSILQDCPPDMQPTWVESKSKYVFNNGSSMELIGLDMNPDGARGTGIDGAALDEAGFFDKLEYLMTSILLQQMLGRPWARILAGSTPPVSPSHYWSANMIPDAVTRNAHEVRTLLDADQYTAEEKDAFIKLAGGRESTTCRREYFAEHISEETMAIIPEFRHVEQSIVRDHEPPFWRDCYVSMDPGWKDLTAVLFGYWDFDKAILVVEDEIAAPAQNSRAIAAAIKRKEKELWSSAKRWSLSKKAAMGQPYLRISDNDLRLIADLRDEHSLIFVPTQKDHLDQQVNAVRNAISAEKIVISPKCVRLIKHLRNAVWRNENRNTFAREGGELGHFDLLAALIYLWRNVNKHRNPKPPRERYVAGIRVEEEKNGRTNWGRTKGRAGLDTKWAVRVRNKIRNGPGQG